MKKTIMVFLSILAFGCSSNEDDETIPVTPAHIDFKLIIDGTEINYPVIPHESGITDYKIYKKGDVLYVSASDGNLAAADATFQLEMQFSTAGKFITGSMKFNSSSAGSPVYKNYINFPSNYITVSDFALDETNKKVKFKFTGKLFMDNLSLTSEARNLYGEIDMSYHDNGNNVPYYFLYNNYIEQYCKANLNTVPWAARFENSLSAFTCEDAYKIEFHFVNLPAPANYSFTSSSTNNYVRLSKFNPSTLTYEYYNTSGDVSYSQRQNHGGTSYSFIGNFSFTAVNPNNPSDVIQATDGTFHSLQQF